MEKDTKGYYRKVHFWGMLTLLLGIVFCLIYGLYLSFVLNAHPGWDKIFAGLLGIGAIIGHSWINIADTMTDIILMGPAATYMSSLSGNIKNMRLPSVLSSLAAVGLEPGTPKADIISTLSVISSTVVNTTFLVILVTAGSTILTLMPPYILDALQYIVPALFGAIFAQFALMNRRAAAIALMVSALIFHFNMIPGNLKAFAAILMTVTLNVLMCKMNEKRKNEEHPAEM